MSTSLSIPKRKVGGEFKRQVQQRGSKKEEIKKGHLVRLIHKRKIKNRGEVPIWIVYQSYQAYIVLLVLTVVPLSYSPCVARNNLNPS